MIDRRGRRQTRSPNGPRHPLPRVTFVVFHALYVSGAFLTDVPLMIRKALLADNLSPAPDIEICDYVEDEGLAPGLNIRIRASARMVD